MIKGADRRLNWIGQWVNKMEGRHKGSEQNALQREKKWETSKDVEERARLVKNTFNQSSKSLIERMREM